MPPVDGLSPLHPAASFDLAFDRPELLAILAWAITSSFGVVLFAFVIRAGTAPIGPAALAVLVDRDARRRRGSTVAEVADRAQTALAARMNVSLPVRGGVAAEELLGLGQPGARTRPSGGLARPALRFDKAPAKGVERRAIGYHQVRVSAGPDDVRTAELGRVDRGDEIELIGEDAGYLQVRTPTGLEGWVPRVVILGAPRIAGAPVAPDKPETARRLGRRSRRRAAD